VPQTATALLRELQAAGLVREGECPKIGGMRGTRLLEGLQLSRHSSSDEVAGGTQKRFDPQSLDSPEPLRGPGPPRTWVSPPLSTRSPPHWQSMDHDCPISITRNPGSGVGPSCASQPDGPACVPVSPGAGPTADALRADPTAALRAAVAPPGDRYIWEPGPWHWNGVQ